MTQTILGFYQGRGVAATSPRWQDLPKHSPDELTHPAGYLAPAGLVAAVNVALDLGMPLLLTGDPGCGKSQLAYSLAWELGFPRNGNNETWAKPLCFSVKSDTQSRDLFYSFDTLGRFHAAHTNGGEINPRHYLRFEALGLAILQALGPQAIETLGLKDCLDAHEQPSQPQRSVVLIDEIDKAPREVPNDILNEIDSMSFAIPELFAPGQKQRTHVALQDGLRPVVVITSNRERELPEAFLRRCVYYHLDMPPFRADPNKATDDPSIEDIIERRLQISIAADSRTANSDKTVWAACIALFRHLRQQAQLQKSPSTAELLNWMQLLKTRLGAEPAKVKQHLPLFRASATVTLFKEMEDQARAERLLTDWLG